MDIILFKGLVGLIIAPLLDRVPGFSDIWHALHPEFKAWFVFLLAVGGSLAHMIYTGQLEPTVENLVQLFIAWATSQYGHKLVKPEKQHGTRKNDTP